MPDPEPSLLANSLHLSVGRSGRSVVSHRDLPLGRGDGLPRGLTITTDFHIPLRLCSYLRSHFALHPLWSWCLWKETQSISGAWKSHTDSGHRWLPALRKCSGELRCCWCLLLRHKPFMESEKRPASPPSKANEYLCVQSWRAATANSLEMPRPEKS